MSAVIRDRVRLRTPVMRTTIHSYKNKAGRLDVEGIDFDAFRRQPLSAGALRCLRYMHDVEHHTVCYLRDLLMSPAHREPDVTSFLACWVYEELWHGEAIGAVLEAHGEVAGAQRISALRQRRRRRDTTGMAVRVAASSLAASSFVALHMTWGAVNEWTTQAGYARLAATEAHPVLTELLQRIMKQEGRHIDFYASEAERRLSESARARRITRWALQRFWRPVGSGVMPTAEVSFLVQHLFDNEEGRAMAARIDRRIDRLPGQQGLGLLTGAVGQLSPATGSATGSAVAKPATGARQNISSSRLQAAP